MKVWVVTTAAYRGGAVDVGTSVWASAEEAVRAACSSKAAGWDRAEVIEQELLTSLDDAKVATPEEMRARG